MLKSELFRLSVTVLWFFGHELESLVVDKFLFCLIQRAECREKCRMDSFWTWYEQCWWWFANWCFYAVFFFASTTKWVTTIQMRLTTIFLLFVNVFFPVQPRLVNRANSVDVHLERNWQLFFCYSWVKSRCEIMRKKVHTRNNTTAVTVNENEKKNNDFLCAMHNDLIIRRFKCAKKTN